MLLEGLASRRETTHDLLSNLFKGYAAASGNKFGKYIERKQEEYEDVTYIKPTALMSFADEKYKNSQDKGDVEFPFSRRIKYPCLKDGNRKVKAVSEGNPLCPTRKSKKETVRKEVET